MPREQIPVQLAVAEVKALQGFVSHGQKNAREINRARILLMSHAGQKVEAIQQSLGVSRTTVYNIRNAYHRHEHDDILTFIQDKPRSGRPLEFDSRVEAKVSMIACSEPPAGSARWTLELIGDKLVKLEVVDSISHESVRQLLKKTNSSPG